MCVLEELAETLTRPRTSWAELAGLNTGGENSRCNPFGGGAPGVEDFSAMARAKEMVSLKVRTTPLKTSFYG